MKSHDSLWQAKVAYWIVKRLPYLLIKEPERVLISYFAIVTGLIMMIPYYHPESIDSALNPPLVYVWAASFLMGGAAKFAGLAILINVKITEVKRVELGRLAERFGASLIALGCFVYAVVVLDLNGKTAFMTFIMFFGIAITNLIRLAVSVANGYITASFTQGA